MFGAFFGIMSQLLGVGGGLTWGSDYLFWDAGNNMTWRANDDHET